MSSTDGRSTRTVPTELDELAAARRDAFERSETAWAAYQAAIPRGRRKETAYLRLYWQEREVEWLRAQKAWIHAYDAWAAEKGYAGDAPAYGAPPGDAP